MSMFKTSLLFLLFLSYSASGVAKGCDQLKADALVRQANDVGVRGNIARQQGLLESALRSCASHAEALNNLGVLSENKGRFKQALRYYRQALTSDASFAIPWLGIGDVYQKQGQLPLALEAYLNACQQDNDAKKKVIDLLKNETYRSIKAGVVLNKDSLLALYDQSRHQAILSKTKRCGFTARLAVNTSGVFRNLRFETGKASLRKSALPQIEQIAAAVISLRHHVKIDGHSDKKPFKGRSQAESDRLNRQLSSRRANAIKKALVQQGVSAMRIDTQGHGPDDPLVLGHSEAAYAKNRRVEIGFQK